VCEEYLLFRSRSCTYALLLRCQTHSKICSPVHTKGYARKYKTCTHNHAHMTYTQTHNIHTTYTQHTHNIHTIYTQHTHSVHTQSCTHRGRGPRSPERGCGVEDSASFARSSFAGDHTHTHAHTRTHTRTHTHAHTHTHTHAHTHAHTHTRTHVPCLCLLFYKFLVGPTWCHHS